MSGKCFTRRKNSNGSGSGGTQEPHASQAPQPQPATQLEAQHPLQAVQQPPTHTHKVSLGALASSYVDICSEELLIESGTDDEEGEAGHHTAAGSKPSSLFREGEEEEAKSSPKRVHTVPLVHTRPSKQVRRSLQFQDQPHAAQQQAPPTAGEQDTVDAAADNDGDDAFSFPSSSSPEHSPPRAARPSVSRPTPPKRAPLKQTPTPPKHTLTPPKLTPPKHTPLKHTPLKHTAAAPALTAKAAAAVPPAGAAKASRSRAANQISGTLLPPSHNVRPKNESGTAGGNNSSRGKAATTGNANANNNSGGKGSGGDKSDVQTAAAAAAAGSVRFQQAGGENEGGAEQQPGQQQQEPVPSRADGGGRVRFASDAIAGGNEREGSGKRGRGAGRKGGLKGARVVKGSGTAQGVSGTTQSVSAGGRGGKSGVASGSQQAGQREGEQKGIESEGEEGGSPPVGVQRQQGVTAQQRQQGSDKGVRVVSQQQGKGSGVMRVVGGGQQQKQQQQAGSSKALAVLRERAPAQTVMEAHERGELVQAQDDATYALDGLVAGASLDTQRESACALLEILATRRGRVALRSEGLAQQVLTGAAKTKGQKDPALALAFSGLLLSLAAEDALPAYLSSSAAAVLATQLLQVDHDYTNQHALAATLSSNIRRAASISNNGTNEASKKGAAAARNGAVKDGSSSDVFEFEGGTGSSTQQPQKDSTQQQPQKTEPQEPGVVSGLAAVQRVLRVIGDGLLGRVVRAGAGAAGTPLRSHIPLVTLSLATATGTEAGRVHHAAKVKDNLRRVDALKKLGLLVPAYTSKLSALIQQQQQQQQPQQQQEQENGAGFEQQGQEQHQSQQKDMEVNEQQCKTLTDQKDSQRNPHTDQAQQQQHQQEHNQQQQLAGMLAELRLVLLVLENCTFTCVENENELLQLKVSQQQTAMQPPSQEQGLQPPPSQNNGHHDNSTTKTTFLSSLLELVKLLGHTASQHRAASAQPTALQGEPCPVSESACGSVLEPACVRGCQECLQAALAVLMNMTHDHEDGVCAMAQAGGLEVVAELVADCCGSQQQQSAQQQRPQVKQEQQQNGPQQQNASQCCEQQPKQRRPRRQSQQEQQPQQQGSQEQSQQQQGPQQQEMGEAGAVAHDACVPAVSRATVLQQLEVLSVCLGLLINMTSLSPENRERLRHVQLGRGSEAGVCGFMLTAQPSDAAQPTSAVQGQGGVQQAANADAQQAVTQQAVTAGSARMDVVVLLSAIIRAMAEAGAEQGEGAVKTEAVVEGEGAQGAHVSSATASAVAPSLPTTGYKTFGRRLSGGSGGRGSAGPVSAGSRQAHVTKQQTQQEMQQQSGEEQMEMGNGKALSSAKSNGRAVKAEEGVCIGGGAKDENGQQPMEGVCGAGEKQEGNAQQGENREAGQDREAEENREAGQDRVTGESRGGMSSGEGGEVTAEALQDEHQQAEASIIQVYASMLLGFTIQDCPAACALAASLMPGGTLAPLLASVQQCLAFYVSAGAITDVSRDAMVSLLHALSPPEENADAMQE